jgi:hypothetical protein
VVSPSLGVTGTQQQQSVWLVGQVAVGWLRLHFLVLDLLQQILAVSLPQHDQTRLQHASHCLHSETEPRDDTSVVRNPSVLDLVQWTVVNAFTVTMNLKISLSWAVAGI